MFRLLDGPHKGIKIANINGARDVYLRKENIWLQLLFFVQTDIHSNVYGLNTWNVLSQTWVT